ARRDTTRIRAACVRVGDADAVAALLAEGTTPEPEPTAASAGGMAQPVAARDWRRALAAFSSSHTDVAGFPAARATAAAVLRVRPKVGAYPPTTSGTRGTDGDVDRGARGTNPRTADGRRVPYAADHAPAEQCKGQRDFPWTWESQYVFTASHAERADSCAYTRQRVPSCRPRSQGGPDSAGQSTDEAHQQCAPRDPPGLGHPFRQIIKRVCHTFLSPLRGSIAHPRRTAIDS